MNKIYIFNFTFLIFVRSSVEQTVYSDIYLLQTKLVNLGGNLVIRLKSPPKDGGNQFMVDMQLYNKENENLITLIEKNRPKNLTSVLEEILYHNPNLMDTDFCEDDLKEQFNWSNDDIIQFYKMRELTNELYNILVDIHQRFLNV